VVHAEGAGGEVWRAVPAGLAGGPDVGAFCALVARGVSVVFGADGGTGPVKVR